MVRAQPQRRRPVSGERADGSAGALNWLVANVHSLEGTVAELRCKIAMLEPARVDPDLEPQNCTDIKLLDAPTLSSATSASTIVTVTRFDVCYVDLASSSATAFPAHA